MARYRIPSESDSEHEEDHNVLTLFDRRQLAAYSGEPEVSVACVIHCTWQHGLFLLC